ncbi:MAG: CARDB domain-containing protein [bacterium]|nr:CARDB domain-containing protein [bacterium]
MRALTINFRASKLLLRLLTLGFCLLAFLLLVRGAQAALVTNTINPDDILNDRPETFLGSDGFVRAIYHDSNQKIIYVQCLSDICTTSTRTELNIGSGVVNNGNVVAYKKSGGDLRIFFIATDAGVHTLRRIDCDTADTCTSASVVYTFGNFIFGAHALSVDKDSNNQARFLITLTDITSGTPAQRVAFYYCTGECVSGSVTQSLLYGTSFAGAGFYVPKIVISAGNFPLLAFQQQTTTTAGQMRYVQCTATTCSTRVNTTIESYSVTSSMIMGVADMVIKGDSFPFIVYSRILDGTLVGKIVTCSNASCSSRTSADITNGNMPRLLKMGDNTLRVFYQLNSAPTELHYKVCSANDCTGATDTLIEAYNSIWPGPFVNIGGFPQAVFNSNPGGGIDLRMACGLEGPVCPSPNLVVRNAGAEMSPAITYTSPVIVNTNVNFTFTNVNAGPGVSADSVTRVTVACASPPCSTNDAENITISGIDPFSASPVQTFTTNFNTTGSFTLTFQADYQNDNSESNETDNSVSIVVNVSPPGVVSYTISVSPSARAVAQGSFYDYTVTVNVTSGAPAAINLTANDLTGKGITQTLTPASLAFAANGSQTASLHVVVSSGTSPDPPNNPYTLTVSATVSGLPNSTQSANTKLGVIAAGTGPWLQTTGGDLGSRGPITLTVPAKKFFPNPVTQDGTIESDGVNGICRVGSGSFVGPTNSITAGKNGDRFNATGFIGFDTANIVGKTVVGAKLTLTVKEKNLVFSATDFDVTLYKQNWGPTLDPGCGPGTDVASNGGVETPPGPTFNTSSITAAGQKVIINLTDLSWISSFANDGFTGYRIIGAPSGFTAFGYVAFYQAEEGSPNAPILEVDVSDYYTHTDYLGISESSIAAGFSSAKRWVVPNYASSNINSVVPVGQDVYSYLYGKFGGDKATVLDPTAICSPPSTFGFTSYGFRNDLVGNSGGNATNCVLTDLNGSGTAHLNLFSSGGTVDNGVFIFKGDGTHNGDLTWSVADPDGDEYTIPSGNPTIIFVTGNFYINTAIRVSNSKKFIFIVKNDSNNDGSLDTDDAIQVNPTVSRLDGFFLTRGKFNSFKWINERNQTRYDRARTIEDKIKEYRAFKGNYPPSSSSYDTSDGCSWNTTPTNWWYEPVASGGLGPVGNTNWDGKTSGVNNIAGPCTSAQGLRYELNRNDISGYTPIDINSYKDPTNGTAIPGKPAVPRPKKFALRYAGIAVGGSATANAYDIFFSTEDDAGADGASTAPDPEFHMCGGNYNASDSYLRSEFSQYCYIHRLVVNGGLYAEGGFSLGRDLHDENNSSIPTHPPTPAEQVNLDPAFYFIFAKTKFLGSQGTISKELSP